MRARNLPTAKRTLLAEPSALLPNGSRRRAKIICTIGPACHTEEAMRDLMRLGMDVGRLNFSHGTHEDHARNIERLRLAAEKENRICRISERGTRGSPNSSTILCEKTAPTAGSPPYQVISTPLL